MITSELQAALPERYRVEREIGRGGMAIVYLATDLTHNREVAVKVLSPELGSGIDADRFKREIQIVARLSHPNILPAYDSGESNGLLYYVMPFITGESLRARLDRESQLAIEDAVAITCEVVDALAYAHAQGVIHRDIKPENILLQAGHAVVADFGIAKMVQDANQQKLTATGMSLGTASYMSPEQFSGDAVDGRSDLYSLACVLYEMLVGEVPFTGPNVMAVMARHTMQAASPVRLVRPSVPESVDAAILHALEKVPADRFQRVEEFRDALLSGAEAAQYVKSTRAYTAAYTAAHRTRKPVVSTRTRILAGVGALTLLTGGGLGVQHILHTRAAASSGDADERHVGVLYFADESPGGQLRYMADGLTESLIDQLSEVPTLDVVSAAGVRPYRNGAVPTDSIARALSVGSVVRGVVEPAAKGVKVTVRLVDPQSDVDLAKTSVELDTTDAIALRKKVAEEVTSFLRQRLGNQIRLREQRAAMSNGRAWLLVQRAEKRYKDADSLVSTGRVADAEPAFAQADSMLSVAESLDKGGAEVPAARARVALAHAQSLVGDVARLAPAIDSGLAYAERALRADPRSADALEYKGQLLFLQYQQHLILDPRRSAAVLADAESTLVRSVGIARNQAGAWATLSAIYNRNSQLQLANSAAYNAYTADAYLRSAKAVLTRLFLTSYNLESFPEAMQWCNEGRRRFPREPFFTQCRLYMYLSKHQAPDVDSAWSYAATFAALSPEAKRVVNAKVGRMFVAGAIARAGLADSARRVILASRATPVEDPRREVEGTEAIVRVMLREPDEAMRLIEDYLTVNPEHRSGFAARTMWWWRDLQGNPRFTKIITGAR